MAAEEVLLAAAAASKVTDLEGSGLTVRMRGPADNSFMGFITKVVFYFSCESVSAAVLRVCGMVGVSS